MSHSDGFLNYSIDAWRFVTRLLVLKQLWFGVARKGPAPICAARHIRFRWSR